MATIISRFSGLDGRGSVCAAVHPLLHHLDLIKQFGGAIQDFEQLDQGKRAL